MNDEATANAPLRDFDEAMRYLASQTNYEQRLDWSYRRLDEQLPNVADFLDERLGGPHKRLPRVIHVAGTKGKGSTCLMLEAALRAQGIRTGLYSSPHLSHITERIRVDGKPIAPERFAALLERLRPELDAWREQPKRWPITFFEILTAMALVTFAEEAVDVALLEVGLGGRLDATNVVDADVAVVTAIGYDHTDKLGETLPEIAREKAGIFKPGRVAVVGPMPEPAAAQAVREVAEALRPRPPMLRMADDGAFGADRGTSGTLRLRSAAWPERGLAALELEAPLPERPRQTDANLACALEALRALAGEATPPSVATLDLRAAARAAGTCTLPGRFESMRGTSPSGASVPVILDCAHNAQSLAAVAGAVRERDLRPVVLLGLNRDKLTPEVLAPLARVAAHAVATTVPGSARAAGPTEVATAWMRSCAGASEVELVAECEAALAHALARAAATEAPLLITGSVYLAGALRGHLVAPQR